MNLLLKKEVLQFLPDWHTTLTPWYTTYCWNCICICIWIYIHIYVFLPHIGHFGNSICIHTLYLLSRIMATGFSGFARILLTGWWQSEYWGVGGELILTGFWLLGTFTNRCGHCVDRWVQMGFWLSGAFTNRWGHCVDRWVKMGTRWAPPFSEKPFMGSIHS